MGIISPIKSSDSLAIRKLLEQTAAEKGVSPEQYLELLERSLTIAGVTAFPSSEAEAEERNERDVKVDDGSNNRAIAAQVQSLLRTGVKAARLQQQLTWASQLVGSVTFVKIETVLRHHIVARIKSLPDIGVILPNHEQVCSESYRVGQTLAVYMLKANLGASSVSLIASRTSPGLVRELVAEHLLVGPNTAFSIERVRRQPGEKSEIILTRCSQQQHQHQRSAATKAKPVSFSWETEKLKYVQELLPAGEQLEFREGAARPGE